MKYQKITFTTILAGLSLLCAAAAPKAFGVVPPPDGGYPGFNTAEGQNALFSLTTGTYNTAAGIYSLLSLTEGNFNTATGAGTLLVNTADGNTATGAAALLNNTTGFNNTANGGFALFDNIAGSGNTADGASALFSNTTGNQNTAIGLGALANNSFGNNNTAIGYQALVDNTTGTSNTALGFAAGNSVTSANSVIAIGTAGANVNNSCFIGHIRGVQTANADAIPVLIDSAGQLGTTSSSRRFKKEIKPMNKASEALLALKPVTFHYKGDKTNTPQFGLIAEEVAAVNPNLVVRDENGEIYTVRYEAVNAMLLNEFLKEHRKVEQQAYKMDAADRKIQEQEATIAELKSGMKALAATVNEQAAQLQKVSARIEVSKSAPRTIVNNR